MKNQYLVFFVFISVFLGSCKDEAEGRIEINDAPPARVANVTTTPGPGEVYLAWQNPSDASFMYTKIEYTNSKGDSRYRLISGERVGTDNIARDTIRGFANTDPQTFSLFACSVRGTYTGAVEVSESPQTPAFTEVARTITLEPDLGGIIVYWENIYTAPVYIVLNYQAAHDPGKKGTKRITAPGHTKNGEFVALTYGEDNDLLSGEECIVTVTTEDEEENSSEEMQIRITPTGVVKISKAEWSFPGYNDNSSAETIGYSSQEAGGEGASPQGRVIAMLDDDLATFWHASWKTTAYYPHWFIVDIGKDIKISTIELIRRQGDARGQTGHSISTCPDANAANKTTPESWLWDDHGSFSFDITTDDPQSYRLTSNPVARYIKIYFGTEHKGTGDQAMLAEINVYGAEEE